MFRIRGIQSEWYMDLFHSGREQWHDPYPYIWKQYTRMTQWFNDMPQSTLPSVRSFFELELLYSYVYILSPSPRIPRIHEYAQRLIFEHCIAYATNLCSVLSTPFNTTKPPVTFYDAMRAYMTGRQFVDVLSRNIDMILDPRPPTPPAPTGPQIESDDPLAPPASISAPPFPAPMLIEGQMAPLDPTTRAIKALDDFTSVLSNFGLRFGFTHWRDRFTRESAALSAQLYQRNTTSPHASPSVQQIPSPPTFPPRWVPMPSASPQAPHLVYGHPTTPPSLFPQQPSPFSSSMSYAGTPYDAQGTSPSMTYETPSQNQQMWGTPSPQPLPDMPQPTEGRKRQALVFSANMAGQGHSPGTVSNQTAESAGWLGQQGTPQLQQTDGSGWPTGTQPQQPDGSGWTTVAQQDQNSWGQGTGQQQPQQQQQQQQQNDGTGWAQVPQTQADQSTWNQGGTQNWGQTH
jgi:hypothetical protein